MFGGTAALSAMGRQLPRSVHSEQVLVRHRPTKHMRDAALGIERNDGLSVSGALPPAGALPQSPDGSSGCANARFTLSTIAPNPDTSLEVALASI